MKTILIIISLLCWNYTFIQAQCDKTLVQKVSEQLDKNAIPVRDFKVKLREGDRRNPSPSKRFTVLMQKDITYSFQLVGAVENAQDAILQLYDQTNLLGSTFDFEKDTNLCNFRYQCPRTGNYQVIISFHHYNAGCAAGLMAMLIDSAFLNSRNQAEDELDNDLFMGIRNQLEISTDSLGEDKLEVSIDNGSIIHKRDQYIAIIEHGNKAIITVKRLTRDGKVLDETVREYKVVVLPEPKVRLENVKSDFISYPDLGTINRLEVLPSVYKIVEFYISSYQTPYSGFRSNDDFLSDDQLAFLKELLPNNRFYIHDIKVEKPDGTMVSVKSLEYFVK